jgi:hypothetical protein
MMEVGPSSPIVIERPLFQRLIHLLICLTVLVCPAMGGRCCGGADDFQTASSAVSCCSDGCHHDDVNDSQNDPPSSPSCPNECRDCFCAGALPPAFETPMPQLDFDALAAFVVLSMDAPLSLSVDRVFEHRDFYGGSKPPSGRAVLTSYCTLLL